MDKNDPLLVDNIPPGVYLVFNAQLFPISKAVTKIGRKLDNDLVLQDTTISRYHAEIHFEENQFVIKDLNSSGGTFLNNRKVSEGVLFSGDIILLSRIPIMFMSEGASMQTKSTLDTGELPLNQVKSLDAFEQSRKTETDKKPQFTSTPDSLKPSTSSPAVPQKLPEEASKPAWPSPAAPQTSPAVPKPYSPILPAKPGTAPLKQPASPQQTPPSVSPWPPTPVFPNKPVSTPAAPNPERPASPALNMPKEADQPPSSRPLTPRGPLPGNISEPKIPDHPLASPPLSPFKSESSQKSPPVSPWKNMETPQNKPLNPIKSVDDARIPPISPFTPQESPKENTTSPWNRPNPLQPAPAIPQDQNAGSPRPINNLDVDKPAKPFSPLPEPSPAVSEQPSYQPEDSPASPALTNFTSGSSAPVVDPQDFLDDLDSEMDDLPEDQKKTFDDALELSESEGESADGKKKGFLKRWFK